MRLFPLTIAVALSASLALSACASRKPTPTRLDPLAGQTTTDPVGGTTPGGTAGAGLPGDQGRAASRAAARRERPPRARCRTSSSRPATGSISPPTATS
jgi:hypothetical protein